MAIGWFKKRSKAREHGVEAEAQDTVFASWQVVSDLARDVTSADAIVEMRMRSAMSNVDEFIHSFVADEPDHGDIFNHGFDTSTDGIPLTCFAAIVGASGHLVTIDGNTPLSDILFIFDNQCEDLGLSPLNAQEMTAFKKLRPIDKRQTDLFFHDVAPQLQQACIARDRRLLCWDDRSDSYGYFVVSKECFDSWGCTTFRDHPNPYNRTWHSKLYDPSSFS